MSRTTRSGRERLHGVERLAAVVRHLHREVLVAQRHGDEIGDALLVVDHEDARGRLIPLSSIIWSPSPELPLCRCLRDCRSVS